MPASLSTGDLYSMGAVDPYSQAAMGDRLCTKSLGAGMEDCSRKSLSSVPGKRSPGCFTMMEDFSKESLSSKETLSPVPMKKNFKGTTKSGMTTSKLELPSFSEQMALENSTAKTSVATPLPLKRNPESLGRMVDCIEESLFSGGSRRDLQGRPRSTPVVDEDCNKENRESLLDGGHRRDLPGAMKGNCSFRGSIMTMGALVDCSENLHMLDISEIGSERHKEGDMALLDLPDTLLVLEVPFEQKEKRRKKKSSLHVDSLQERAEAGCESCAKKVLGTVDSLQEQAEAGTESCAKNILVTVDSLQEQAEARSESCAKNVQVSVDSLQQHAEAGCESCAKNIQVTVDSLQEHAEAGCESTAKNIKVTVDSLQELAEAGSESCAKNIKVTVDVAQNHAEAGCEAYAKNYTFAKNVEFLGRASPFAKNLRYLSRVCMMGPGQKQELPGAQKIPQLVAV